MILYEVTNNRFKKDGKRISRSDVEKELKKSQLKMLLEKGKYKVKPRLTKTVKNTKKTKKITTNIIKIEKTPKNEEKQVLKKDKKVKSIFTKSQQRKINEARPLYHIDHTLYRTLGWKYELWCKNKKGFSNFICYIDNDDEETIQKAILNHIKNKLN